MYDERTKETEAISALSKVHGTNRDHWPLKDIIATFTRPMRRHHTRLILDVFGADFFILFDTEEDPECPATKGTVNIAVCPLLADDFLEDSICLVMNANKFGVMRFLAAMGISRFDDRVKTAFYQTCNPLRAN